MTQEPIRKGQCPLYCAEAVLDGSQLSKRHAVGVYGSFVYVHWTDALLGKILVNADPLFALVITPGVYLHHVEVVDQYPASGCL